MMMMVKVVMVVKMTIKVAEACCVCHHRLLMWEPRGHRDMFGVLPVTPDLPEADVGLIFLHNTGYSPMCGHGVICFSR